jgi:shikimate dehydrogenase
VTTKRFAVLGDPIAHSKSPVMHAAAYRALGLDCTYEAIRATPGDLSALVASLRAGAYEGFNVTVPHKRRILEHVDRVAPSAASVGAANTLVRDGGDVVAHNTDVPALAAEIARLAPERTSNDWRASNAIVLGAGGAAASAIAALETNLGVRSVVVRARRGAEPLAPSFRERETLTIVQATSAGMDGADDGAVVADAIGWSELPAGAIALDVVYAPRETAFLRAARAHGVRSANGLGMLAMQGALAFELWLGVPPPYETMLAAIDPKGENAGALPPRPPVA